jgi:hypothetical protein
MWLILLALIGTGIAAWISYAHQKSIEEYIFKKAGDRDRAMQIANAIAKYHADIPSWLLVFLFQLESWTKEDDIIIEFNPYAVGKYGERGLGQITKRALADVLGKKVEDVTKEEWDKLFDIDYNVWVTTRYLQISRKKGIKHLNDYGIREGKPTDDWYLALLYYHRGDNWNDSAYEYADIIWSNYKEWSG